MAGTDVYLISGFLGAGKTTFLNRLVERVPEDVTFLVLMNEFGEVGLDGTLVEADDLDLIEISKGSIFCACVKTDFIKALNEIARTVKPDVMLIETTGVANPRDLDRDLQLPLFGGVFRLQDKFCLIDGANFLETYESFLAIEKQLESSDVYIINKLDLAEPGAVAQIEEIVRGFNPEAVFWHATYADVPFETLFAGGRMGEEGVAPAPLELTEEALEGYIEELLNDEAAEVTPPDRLLSLVVPWPPGSRTALESWLARLPERMVRGKGVVGLDGNLTLFNLVSGRWTLEPYAGPEPPAEVRDRLVFISRPEEIRRVEELSSSAETANREV